MSHVVRATQAAFGGFSQETALFAFRILSLLSGYVYVLSAFSISTSISNESAVRSFIFVALLSSGVVFLFFGYVEFYPLLWASASSFFALSLRYLR
ncbi:MAG TPA: hypothetical protein VLB27_00895, partial [candidate division Zixibacteria bacterium]|nr:hypothetical protein [candidate division Zixibacteria bacterium]